MTQTTLFGPPTNDPPAKPSGDLPVRQRLLIVVKTAPNPSEAYGETVCVAAVRAELENPGWVRLYPINFRALDNEDTFRKYDLVEVDTLPARNDSRRESWKPILSTLRHLDHLKPWAPRRAWLDDYREPSMCDRFAAARAKSDAPSLALITPKDVGGLTITRHPGWTPDEQRKIDAYVNQPDLFSDKDRAPLQAPRFKATYHYRCYADACNGHSQLVLDWELVTHQRRFLNHTDEDAMASIRRRFLDEMCGPNRDVAFFVGNQAKRRGTFSVLGVYWPPR